MPEQEKVDLTTASPGYARTRLHQFRQDPMVAQIDVIHRKGERFETDPFELVDEPMLLPDGKVISTFRRPS